MFYLLFSLFRCFLCLTELLFVFSFIVVFLIGFLKAMGRQTPQKPPLLQYLQALQFLQAEQYWEPVHFFEQQGMSLWNEAEKA